MEEFMLELQQGESGMQVKLDARQLIPEGFRRVNTMDLREGRHVYLFQYSGGVPIHPKPLKLIRDNPFIRLKNTSGIRLVCHLIPLAGMQMKCETPTHEYFSGELDEDGNGRIFLVQI